MATARYRADYILGGMQMFKNISFGGAITIIGLILVLCGYAECQAANYKLIDRIDGVATLSSIGINSHAKESSLLSLLKR